jgi:hypothetical protein
MLNNQEFFLDVLTLADETICCLEALVFDCPLMHLSCPRRTESSVTLLQITKKKYG